MGLKKRERYLAIAAIVCIGLLAGERLVFTPLSKIWQERSQRTAELQQSIQDEKSLADREGDLRAEWKSMKDQSLPADDAEAENLILKAVNRWAESSRLALTTLKPRRSQEGKDFRTLEFQSTARGSLKAITRFLYELESDPLPLKIEAIEIAAADDNGDSITLSLRFSGLLLEEANP